MPRALNIDAARLRELAGDAAIKSKDIPAHFGMARSTFFLSLSESDALWDIYEQARRAAGHTVRGQYQPKKSRSTTTDSDERRIVAAIKAGARTPAELRAAAIAAGVDAGRFATVLYNLENEKHDIWSITDGHPPVTRYFVKGESEPPAVAGGQRFHSRRTELNFKAKGIAA